jgi:hypothetical protein
VTNADKKRNLAARDRPMKGSYLLRFFGFACALGLCGVGGVDSILRSTSSSLGAGCSRFGFSARMVGV